MGISYMQTTKFAKPKAFVPKPLKPWHTRRRYRVIKNQCLNASLTTDESKIISELRNTKRAHRHTAQGRGKSMAIRQWWERSYPGNARDRRRFSKRRLELEAARAEIERYMFRRLGED
jgi:hypothetical protein